LQWRNILNGYDDTRGVGGIILSNVFSLGLLMKAKTQWRSNDSVKLAF